MNLQLEWDQKIFQVRKGETVYNTSLIPIGGYVRMAGHDEDEQEIKPGMMITIVLDCENVVQKLKLRRQAYYRKFCTFPNRRCRLT